MTAEELRKLSRTDLMEVLIAQMKENEVLQKQVEKAKKLLSEREIAIRESGTMAEAAMKLCGVFEAADATQIEPVLVAPFLAIPMILLLLLLFFI